MMIKMSRVQDMLLQRTERFLRITGMPATTFGKLTLGDTHLVKDMRDGKRELRWNTLMRLEKKLSNTQWAGEGYANVRCSKNRRRGNR
jgi:hypothetical protein